MFPLRAFGHPRWSFSRFKLKVSSRGILLVTFFKGLGFQFNLRFNQPLTWSTRNKWKNSSSSSDFSFFLNFILFFNIHQTTIQLTTFTLLIYTNPLWLIKHDRLVQSLLTEVYVCATIRFVSDIRYLKCYIIFPCSGWQKSLVDCLSSGMVVCIFKHHCLFYESHHFCKN